MRTFGDVPSAEQSALVEEAGRLLTLVEPDAPDRDVDLTVDRARPNRS
ncbi:hypothetical protein [Micromonospora globispora]|nr:hypothetical protein [Micromonospora globispora]